MTSPEEELRRRTNTRPDGETGRGSRPAAANIGGRATLRPVFAAPERAEAAADPGSAPAANASTGAGTENGRPNGNHTFEANAGRRVLLAQDFLNAEGPLDQESLLLSRAHAATQFHLELAEARTQLGLIRDLVLPTRTIPTKLLGRVLQPDGTPGERLEVELVLQTATRTLRRNAITDRDGRFSMGMPAATPFPTPPELRFSIRGENGGAQVTIASSDIATSGLMSNLELAVPLQPLPQSIVASLTDLLPVPGTQGAPEPETPEALFPDLAIGEEGGCQLIYRSDASFDRFPYSVFFRMVEPRTSVVTPSFRITLADGSSSIPVAAYSANGANLPVEYVDRVPVDQPISVDGFRDQLIGTGAGSVVSPWETVPMAGTLGLGYVLRMAQLWTPKGLTLGNLVYSLPLAPGEQQRVAVFERREQSFVTERESLSVDEEQSFQQETDASTQAVFASAMNESASGGSRFYSEADSSGYGWFALVAAGGGGSSASSGNSSSWMSGHRDTASRATQDVQTGIERHAAASRRAVRTGMRLATSFESSEVTTKVITNHNHTRALTLQYWEVHRLYEVSSTVEGVTLVCLVPLQVIRFLPAFQPLNLTNPASLDQRFEIMARYSVILKHADVLERWLPRQYRFGLNLIKQFAADPTAEFEPAGAAAQDVIHFSLRGTFLPFEEIYVSAVTKRGTRVGGARLTGAIPVVPEVWNDPSNSFPTQDALMAELRSRRNGATGHLLEGDLAVPPSLARNDIVGFEITRRFQHFDYDLVNPGVQVIQLFGFEPDAPPDHLVTGTVKLTPQIAEQELGGPYAWDFDATIHAVGSANEETYAENYLTNRQQLPPNAFPIPAIQLAPVLRYSQLLEVERMLQHVVRNTVRYSKAVWLSLTPEERVIMLEGYTIGVPPGGIEDETQNVPLLNCVENRVLGFYGNSMIMPFIIPRSVADDMEISNADIQDLLEEFHETGFSPKKSVVALPTRGVLAEAVLGHCPSAEKIDITRFWNWQDSSADGATEIAPVQLPVDKTVAATLQGPGGLTGLTPLINNINANPNAPGADAALVQALAQAAAQQQGFDVGALTNAESLAKLILGNQSMADNARSQALETTKQLNAQAMATAGNILGGIYGDNPTAGSEAAGSVYGTSKDKPAPAKKEEPKKEEAPEGGGDDEGGGGG